MLLEAFCCASVKPKGTVLEIPYLCTHMGKLASITVLAISRLGELMTYARHPSDESTMGRCRRSGNDEAMTSRMLPA